MLPQPWLTPPPLLKGLNYSNSNFVNLQNDGLSFRGNPAILTTFGHRLPRELMGESSAIKPTELRFSRYRSVTRTKMRGAPAFPGAKYKVFGDFEP